MVRERQMTLIAGVDEAGRGPLAGPVLAAAVILDPSKPIEGLTDSKLLTEKARQRLYHEIKAKALAYHVSQATVEEIEGINILQASLLAMKRAVEGLTITPDEIWVDGTYVPKVSMPGKAIIEGDLLHANISAASILAKVDRDEIMVEYAKIHPEYGFEKHKGYPTKDHLLAIKAHGVLPIHRKTYGPVKKHLEQLEHHE
ncbi:MAG: ribonuclease HII [Gammaproteobacteria bacterium]